MSVVVVREGILYTDSVGVLAPCNYKKKIDKRAFDPNGDLVYAFCGDLPRKKDIANFMEQARRWFQNWYFGADQEGIPDPDEVKKFLPDAWLLVCWNDGFLSYKYGKITIHEIDDVVDGGDGGTFTVAGLDLGLRGKDLEELVNDCSVTSGLGIVEFDLRTLVDPINETEIEIDSVEPKYCEADTVSTEWAPVMFSNGMLSFGLRQIIPWRNTERADWRVEDLYTDYGFFIPWGGCARLFLEFSKTGYFDHQQAGQGTSAGMMISSDGMIYDISIFGMNLSELVKSTTKPGYLELLPLGFWHDEFTAVKGNGWVREYIEAMVRAGIEHKTICEMAFERFPTANPNSYARFFVKDIIDRLKERGIKPVTKHKLRNTIDFKVLAKHYKELHRLFPDALVERYKL